jgi:hypothetical protein
MSLSNLPPGVTGREYEIAGPDAEFVADRNCGNTDIDCGFSGEVDVTRYGYEETFTCPKCGAVTTMDSYPD